MSNKVMKVGAKLKREGDNKEFTVTWLGYWSDITADGGESYTVKRFGPDDAAGPDYISLCGLVFKLTD